MNWFTDSKTIVVGDIHGDLNQLMYPLIEFLKNERQYDRIVFLGDYIDRGESNLYTYGIVKFIMSINEYKNKVIFLRGNHECYPTAVRDYYDNNWNTKNWDKRFITSFVYNSIHDEEFNIVDYDSKLGIVFSHSELTRPLSQVLKMNEDKKNESANIANTYTDDVYDNEVAARMEYKNIHGHIHKMSTEKELDSFFKGNRKVISIDGDASYGITLVNNFQVSKQKELISNVRYLVIKSENEYEVIKKFVKYDDVNNNFNMWRFNELKNVLSKCNSTVKKYVDRLRLKDMVNVFSKEFEKEFGVKPNSKNIVELICKRYNDNVRKSVGGCVYFHDIPVDVYNEYGLFNDEKYNCIGKLYWCNVLGMEWIYNKYYLCKSNKEGFVSSSMYAMLLTFTNIVACITAIVVVICIMLRLYARRVRVKSYDRRRRGADQSDSSGRPQNRSGQGGENRDRRRQDPHLERTLRPPHGKFLAVANGFADPVAGRLHFPGRAHGDHEQPRFRLESQLYPRRHSV